MSVFYNKFID